MEESSYNNKNICYACDIIITSKWHWWDGFRICHQCRSRYIDAPICHQKYGKTHNDRYNSRDIFFKGKSIRLEDNPRKGICKLCLKKKGDKYINTKGKLSVVKTHMHHIQYHDDYPLKDTLEICESCHMKESIRLGQIISTDWNNMAYSYSPGETGTSMQRHLT